MMPASVQDIYAAAQTMEHRSVFGRATLLRTLGGTAHPITPGVPAHEAHWRVDLLGISVDGIDLPSALSAWISAARMFCRLTPTRRATDWRPDCPYNGQTSLPVAEA
ncbi:hypothetical protein [Phaeobacter inhibens]|uniref:hypothetical protein n=1 Tax=Phaeobacter inhibens TaxID=221822 RepID=UPI0021A8C25D|nr:hypothetical protein [Phaeobacter inhibens]UWR74100.1 hypothetical protein K4L00_08355 [Phaeobacter inhibens]